MRSSAAPSKVSKAMVKEATQSRMSETITGRVFDIQRFSLHDGPGIRTIVFLKGCPLRCQWCDNPESMDPGVEIGFMKARCDRCGKCVAACGEHAISLDDGGMPQIDSQRCSNCGDCAVVCFPKALLIYGKEMTVAEALEEVQRDEMFYRGSGGGITVSGGEPLQHPSFVKSLLERCRQAGLHTAIETSGFAPGQVLEEILPFIQYVLFDLKHLDSEIHQKVTGRPNTLILENAKLVVASGIPMLFRCPLIPGVNDTIENINETAGFLKAVQGERAALELLPYHRLGTAKYQALRRPYPLEGLQPAEPGSVESVRQTYERLGVRCTVSK